MFGAFSKADQVTRFSTSSSRLQRILARNHGDLVRGISREAGAKLYRHSAVRRVLRAVIPERKPRKWLFLVGCYNSGTTILRRLLESHPEIGGLPFEGVDLTDAFPDLEQGGWPRMMYANRDLWGMDPQTNAWRAERARRDWSVWWKRDASVFLEKSIDHTVNMPWIDAHFPNAYFLGITRNGYCVNEGILRRAAPRGNAAIQVGERYPPEMLAEQWVAINDRLVSAPGKLARFHCLSYEALMADPVQQLRNIFGFLDLEAPTMQAMGHLLTIGSIEHEVIDQNRKSLERLSEQAQSRMRPIMAPMMRQLGYEEKTQ